MNRHNEYPIDALELRHPPLPKGASLKGSSLVGSVRARKWAALGLILATMLAASATFGGTTTPCYEAYLMSGLDPQQTSFGEFRGLYSDTSLCAPGSEAR